ncbi:MAG: ornithine carbamoyltransferase [Candidatus Latescibacteria bacterium]|nr:ornithine carbamoyltransferase [bacterium]MBD3423023.1 ornithine carbamoyltransferase [Candidatus Latescibacterota bacterium]
MKLSRKDFISIRDFSREELLSIIELCERQKPEARNFTLKPTHPGRVLACIFHKPSLRTRISFEVAMMQLGGNSLYLTDKEIGIGSREAPKDVGEVLSRYVDAIEIRTFDQKMVTDLAKYATVPVVNGLTDLLHPCQVLGDIFTIREKLGDIEGKKVVFVGDGNNVSRSWLNASTRFDFKFVLCSPPGYQISDSFIEEARKDGDCDFEWVEDPGEALNGADVVYSDVWASMGQEDEAKERVEKFRPYAVDDDMMAMANDSALFMHCLPAHRGLEVTDSVIDGRHSVVYDQAENRLHIQRAILALLIPVESDI